MKTIKHLLKIYNQVDSNYSITNRHMIYSDEKLFPVIQQICPPNSRYIKHFLHQEWEENSYYYPYVHERTHETVRRVVPYGDLSLFLMVYYEEEALPPPQKKTPSTEDVVFGHGKWSQTTGEVPKWHPIGWGNVSGLVDVKDIVAISPRSGIPLVWNGKGKWKTS